VSGLGQGLDGQLQSASQEPKLPKLVDETGIGVTAGSELPAGKRIGSREGLKPAAAVRAAPSFP